MYAWLWAAHAPWPSEILESLAGVLAGVAVFVTDFLDMWSFQTSKGQRRISLMCRQFLFVEKYDAAVLPGRLCRSCESKGPGESETVVGECCSRGN